MSFISQKLTDWTELDPNSKIAISANSIVATSFGNPDGYVYRQFTVDQFDGWRHRMSVRGHNLTGAGCEVLLWGVTRETLAQSSPLSFGSWTSGVQLILTSDSGSNTLKIKDVTSGAFDVSALLTDDQTYYVELRRHYKHVDVLMFSDSAYETPVDTISLTAISGTERYSVNYLLSGSGASAPSYEGIGDPPSWDKLDEAWTSLPGIWSSAGTGTYAIEPAGQLHMAPSASSYRQNTTTLAAWSTTQFTIEFRHYFDGMGTNASGNISYFDMRDSLHLHSVGIAVDGVWALDSAGNYVQVSANPTSTGVWYDWRFIVDSVNHTFIVERKADGGSWTRHASWTSMKSDTSTPGYLQPGGMWRGSSGSSELHRDYTRIAAGRYYNIDLTVSMDVTVVDVQFNDIRFSGHIFLGKFIPGTIENDCETFPNGFTPNIGSGCTLERSGAWKKTGTYSWHIVGSGENTCGASQAFTPAAIDKVHEANLTYRLASLADGHTARICYLKKSTGYVEQAGITRSGADYFWSITKYNNATWTQTLSRIPCDPDTNYDVRMQYNPASNNTNLYINGMLVLQTSNMSSMAYPGEFGLGSAGGEGTFPGTYEAYFDDVWFGMNFLVFPTMCAMADGNFCIAANYQERHAGNVRNSIKIFTLNKSTGAVALAQTIPAPGTITLYVSKLVSHGSSMYMFCQREGYATGNPNLQTTVYKSADDSVNFSSVCVRNADGIYASNLIENGKICCAGWAYDVNSWLLGQVYNVWYDTATDTFDANKGLIADQYTIADRAPNESTFYRVPGSNALRCLVRFDLTNGGADRSIAYLDSADDGATWGGLTRPTHFQRSGGEPKVVPDTDDDGTNIVWMSIYRSAGTGDSATSVMLQARSSDLEILNEKTLGMASGAIDNEPGNGDMAIETAGITKTFHWVIDNGSAIYLKAKLNSIVSISSPENRSLIGMNTPLLTYSATTGTIEVKVNNVVVEKVSGDYLDALPEGSNTVRVTLTGEDNTVAYDEITFTIDTIAPSVAFSQVLEALISGTNEDGATVTVVPDGPAIASTTSYPTSTTWLCTISNMVSGNNRLTVFVEDAAGNIASIIVNLQSGNGFPGSSGGGSRSQIGGISEVFGG